jgi:tRNA threonylcarbamoyladenosine biosynthesis protein TsaE
VFVAELLTRRSTIRLAQRLAPLLKAADFVCLSGDLGTGKTFFVRALCRALRVPAEMGITSPTFTLVHELEGRLRIVHADAYRLRDEDELLSLGLRDARSEGALLVLEWGAPYVALLGGDALLLAFEHGAQSSGRKVTVSAQGARGEEILRALATGTL